MIWDLGFGVFFFIDLDFVVGSLERVNPEAVCQPDKIYHHVSDLLPDFL